MNLRGNPGIKGLILDIDESILDLRAAWAYTLEQALLSVGSRRVDARPLVETYRLRPWRDALLILEPEAELVTKAEERCEAMWSRSALKRVTVHEGIGMALGSLLTRGTLMAGVSRTSLGLAMLQVQAAGVDRFLLALEACPRNDRAAHGFLALTEILNIETARVAFVSHDHGLLQCAAEAGLQPFLAGWASDRRDAIPALRAPADLAGLRDGAAAAGF